MSCLRITLLQVPGCCCDVEAVAFLDDFLDLNSLLGRSMVLESIAWTLMMRLGTHMGVRAFTEQNYEEGLHRATV